MISVKSKLDREENDLLVIQLQAMDDGTDPGPQTGYASVSWLISPQKNSVQNFVFPYTQEVTATATLALIQFI